MNRFLKSFLTVIFMSFSFGYGVAESKATTDAGVIDFGDPNAKQFATRLKSLMTNKRVNNVVNITQFGDSHTAADISPASMT